MHGKDIGMRRAHRPQSGTRDGLAGKRRHFAGDTEDRERVTPVRGYIEIEDHIVELQIGRERHADGRVRGQFQDSLRALGQAQLPGRTQHPGRLDAAQLRGFDRHAPGEPRPDQRQRALETGARIGGATDDLQRLARSGRDAADLQLLRIRMLLGREDFGHPQIRELRRGRLDRFQLDA
ncbi:hypothetical protein B1A_20388, partial [mine drainage metagenome]